MGINGGTAKTIAAPHTLPWLLTLQLAAARMRFTAANRKSLAAGTSDSGKSSKTWGVHRNVVRRKTMRWPRLLRSS